MKKKVTIAITILLLAGIAIWKLNSTAKEPQTVVCYASPVELIVANISAAPGGLDIVYQLINHTDTVVEYGAYWHIDRLDGENWLQQPIGEETAFIDIMYALAARDTSELYSISLMPERFEYPAGEYRLRKEVYIGEEKQTLHASFRIERAVSKDILNTEHTD